MSASVCICGLADDVVLGCKACHVVTASVRRCPSSEDAGIIMINSS